MKKTIYIFSLLAAVVLSGCGFLDKEPDWRAEINTQKKVRLLLTSAYEMPNYGPICEVSSDNFVDNNTMDASGHTNTRVPFNQMYDQIFAWEDVNSNSAQDSPYSIWEGCYTNIAVANQALSAIETIEAKQGVSLDAERAEALMIRAFNHFVLVNIFCQPYKNDEDSKLDLGIHYMKAAETTVKPDYKRSTVTDTYQAIREDLEAALPYVSDDYYSVAKYHFNMKASYAFAARFYLYTREYDKVIQYANKVVGTNDADALACMFDAASAKEKGNIEQEMYAWFDASSPSNLLITTSMSFALYCFVKDYCRYTLNRDPRDFTFNGAGPCWTGSFPGTNFWRFDANYGGFLAKLYEPFEYTDKVNGIGYPHSLRREFTTGETLLCRAEAKIMTGDIAGAVSDMRIWTKGYCCTTELTDARIRQFFFAGKRAYVTYPDEDENTPHTNQHTPVLHNQDICPNWVITDEQKPYIWCCLHLRRLETMHDGFRWFDIKRYGIELTHKIGYPATYVTLTWDDDRRAFQLPQESILAGMEPNPRKTGQTTVPLTGPTTDPTLGDLLKMHSEKPTKQPVE